MTGPQPYGVVVEFETPDELVEAARAARDGGYRRMEAYSPFQIPELNDIIRMHDYLPLVVLAAGITGAVTGYVMQYYLSVIHYPLNIGGRPLHSWPAFIPITFELTVLFSALATFFGFLWFAGFPAPYHPLFRVPDFKDASADAFFLCIEAHDQEEERGITRFLQSLKPKGIWAVDRD